MADAATRRLYWAFRNPSRSPMDLAVALPVPSAQQEVELVELRGLDAAEPVGGVGPDDIRRVTVPARGSVAIQARVRLVGWSADGGPDPRRVVDDPSDGRWVTPSPSQRLTAETAADLLRDAGVRSGDDPQAVARDVFELLVGGRFSYAYPSDLSAAALARDGAGDCGAFSALFVALCRAAGVPARVVLGAWDSVTMAPHAWAEFEVPGLGWVGSDPSGGLVHGVPSGDAARWHGALPGARIAFSRGLDVPIVDPAGAPPQEESGSRVAGTWRDGRWVAMGTTDEDGTVPYLQPAWPLAGAPDGGTGTWFLWRGMAHSIGPLAAFGARRAGQVARAFLRDERRRAR
ncbi:transglutaminase-like domain-containing protein [Patulibacter americanus]|uniref:transglutaminase-like domain-containing protein n=1 Tax=Patulibacter americanus TaxID=588672 RepID=UPI0003B5304C|nr:transglutaminase domain-containing protein [Patulibacter americanus]